jgi:hypothetical protein
VEEYRAVHHGWRAARSLEQFLLSEATERASEEVDRSEAVEWEAEPEEAVPGCVFRVEPRAVRKDSRVLFLQDGHPVETRLRLQGGRERAAEDMCGEPPENIVPQVRCVQENAL